jgi:Anti-sigma factor NepR
MGDDFKSPDVHTIFASFRKAQLARVIGRQLQKMYSHLLKERLPPRIVELMRRLEGASRGQ